MTTQLLHNHMSTSAWFEKKILEKENHYEFKFLEKYGLMCRKNTEGGDLDDVNLKRPQSSTNVSKTPNTKDPKQTHADFCLMLCTHFCGVLSRDVQHRQQSVNPCR